MRPFLFFAGGLVIGVLAAVLLLRGAGGDARNEPFWRDRAERAERDLAQAREQLGTLAVQLDQLAKKFEDLTARFAALQTGTPAGPASPP